MYKQVQKLVYQPHQLGATCISNQNSKTVLELSHRD